jgi:hypothetical protein
VNSTNNVAPVRSEKQLWRALQALQRQHNQFKRQVLGQIAMVQPSGYQPSPSFNILPDNAILGPSGGVSGGNGGTGITIANSGVPGGVGGGVGAPGGIGNPGGTGVPGF